jgi:hypothetical protein
MANKPSDTPAPTLEDLQRQVEQTAKAVEQLLKSEETENDQKEEWSKEWHDGHLDIFNNGTDVMLEGMLPWIKRSLETVCDIYHEALEESMTEAQQLRWEHQATAGFGTPNAIVEAKIAAYPAKAKELLAQREGIEGRLAMVEGFEEKFDSYKDRRDLYLWLTDNAVVPCKFEKGSIDCTALLKYNGLRKLYDGDTVDRLDQLKMLIKIGAKVAEPMAEFTPYGMTALYGYKFGSLVIDTLYDGLAIHYSKERLQQQKQDDAQLAKARAVLDARMEMLQAEVGCYENNGPAVKLETVR